MAGRPSGAMIRCMELILTGVVPYTASQRAGFKSPGALYRSRLYKLWRDGKLDELNKELNKERPQPRRAKKPQRFVTVIHRAAPPLRS